MTKKEREQLEQLQRDRDLARAARFQFAFDVDIKPDLIISPVRAGFLPDSYSGTTSDAVRTAFVDGSLYYVGERKHAASRDISWSHGDKPIFSTKALALHALRQQVEREMLARLLRIDQMIDAERLNPTPAPEPVNRRFR
jgi:hypothetical protein